MMLRELDETTSHIDSMCNRRGVEHQLTLFDVVQHHFFASFFILFFAFSILCVFQNIVSSFALFCVRCGPHET